MDNSSLYQFALFFGSLILMCVSSYVLTAYLERIGAWLGFSEGLLGILTALGADAPEIASAITALMAGHQELGVGVVVGSNIFNIAVLLGLSSLMAGVIQPGREGLLLDGGVAILVTLIGGVLIGGFIPPWLSALLLVVLLVPYVWISSLFPTHIKRMKLPLPLRKFLTGALTDVRDDSKKGLTQPKASLLDLLVMLSALFAIVVGSQGLVNSTLWLAGRFSMPHATIGMLVIASLTGIPNAIAAVHLALHRRGAAVVTETFNSNTLNIVVGVCLPSLIVGLGQVSTRTVFSLCWLFGISVVAILLTMRRGGLRRIGGGVLLALYAVFVAVIIIWH
jgi:cation:H+ antiporter